MFIIHLSLAHREGPGDLQQADSDGFSQALLTELVKETLGDFPNYDTAEESEAAGLYMVNYQCCKAPSTSLLPLY